MHALSPPPENMLATRAAIIAVVRARLTPLFRDPSELDALPAWLWCVPTHTIAQSLAHEMNAVTLARELAIRIEAETQARHPAERYVTHLAAHHPLMSHVQRARLADFAHHLETEHRLSCGSVSPAQMARHGFTSAECERLAPRAREVIAAVKASGAPDHAPVERHPVTMLRAAGELAHSRRAYAEGHLELGPADAARVASPAAQTTGAAA